MIKYNLYKQLWSGQQIMLHNLTVTSWCIDQWRPRRMRTGLYKENENNAKGID